MTLHGQRQATKQRVWLKDTTKLPFLYKRMIVCINTNGLNGAGRRQVYASTRERARNSDLSRKIFEEVADLIREDETLKYLNHLAREQKLAESSRVANEKVQKRLSKFAKTKLKERFKSGNKRTGPNGRGRTGGTGTNAGTGLGKKKVVGGRRSQRDTEDSHLGNVPTTIAFESNALRVVQGSSTDVWVVIDAKNGYLPMHDDDLDTRIRDASVEQLFVKSRSQLLGGRSRWKIEAASGAPLGTYELCATLMTANGRLEASIPLNVVEPPELKKTGKGGQEEDTGPNIHWVTKDKWNEEWAGKMFNAKTVGAVAADDDETDIFVNRDFGPLAHSFEHRDCQRRR